jgi:hypothetical protein
MRMLPIASFEKMRLDYLIGMPVRNALTSWLVNVVLPCIKYTEVCTSVINVDTRRARVSLLVASVANSSVRTLSCAGHGKSHTSFDLS